MRSVVAEDADRELDAAETVLRHWQGPGTQGTGPDEGFAIAIQLRRRDPGAATWAIHLQVEVS